ncbi:MAG: hypothetical protein ACM31H_01090 [Nitrososphaerales archaeon]
MMFRIILILLIGILLCSYINTKMVYDEVKIDVENEKEEILDTSINIKLINESEIK